MADARTDAFEAPNGKAVVFTCIKHASVRIQYDGFEIQVDPVGDTEDIPEMADVKDVDVRIRDYR